jgi:hypothetical protein
MNLAMLSKTKNLISDHLDQLIALTSRIRPLASKYKITSLEMPFNIVLASSELYYRENFHSDIIASIINHGEFHRKFISWLSQISRKNIDESDYRDRVVAIEEGKIDILVKSEESKHCIIVENKINNAGDMKRQIPRYIEKQRAEGFTIDAVVYLSLDGGKRPDKSSWTATDLDEFQKQNVIYVAATNKSNLDMVNGFLNLCIEGNCTIEEFSFIKQYTELVLYLGRTQMDMNLMGKFYEQMLEDSNYSSAQSIRSMLNDLNTYRRDRLYQFFQNKFQPFDSIGRWSTNDTLFIGLSSLTGENVKLDMCCEESVTRIQFWIQEPKVRTNLIEEILDKMSHKNSFDKKSENVYLKTFRFPEQDSELYIFVENFLSSLNGLVDEENRRTTISS